MRTSDLESELTELLYNACSQYIKNVSNDLSGETVYAFVIHCNSGCEGMMAAVATHESLTRIQAGLSGTDLEEYRKHVPVNVAEWEYIGLHEGLFDDVYDFALNIHTQFEEEDFEDVDLDECNSDELQIIINNVFVKALVQTLSKLKDSGVFNNKIFDKDLLLGAAFSDPGESDKYIMLKVSELINSESNHNKITDYIEFLNR